MPTPWAVDGVSLAPRGSLAVPAIWRFWRSAVDVGRALLEAQALVEAIRRLSAGA